MSVKILYLIIVAVVYIVSRLRKSGESKPVAPRRDSSPSAPKPVSFEDLLREIQESKAPAPKPVPAKTYDYVDYDDEIDKNERPVLEKADFSYRNEDKIYDTYEKAKQEAFYRPSLEETSRLSDTVVRFGQFKGYKQEEERSLAAEYAADLRNPESMKKAFILSEILNRRF